MPAHAQAVAAVVGPSSARGRWPIFANFFFASLPHASHTNVEWCVDKDAKVRLTAAVSLSLCSRAATHQRRYSAPQRLVQQCIVVLDNDDARQRRHKHSIRHRIFCRVRKTGRVHVLLATRQSFNQIDDGVHVKRPRRSATFHASRRKLGARNVKAVERHHGRIAMATVALQRCL